MQHGCYAQQEQRREPVEGGDYLPSAFVLEKLAAQNANGGIRRVSEFCSKLEISHALFQVLRFVRHCDQQSVVDDYVDKQSRNIPVPPASATTEAAVVRAPTRETENSLFHRA